MKQYDDMTVEERNKARVKPSTPANICVDGGFIQGKFYGTSTREGQNGPYSVHGMEGVGVGAEYQKAEAGEAKKAAKPVKLGLGRYGVFGSKNLDALMLEVPLGQNIRINFLGLKPNPKTDFNPEGKGNYKDFEVISL